MAGTRRYKWTRHTNWMKRFIHTFWTDLPCSAVFRWALAEHFLLDWEKKHKCKYPQRTEYFVYVSVDHARFYLCFLVIHLLDRNQNWFLFVFFSNIMDHVCLRLYVWHWSIMYILCDRTTFVRKPTTGTQCMTKKRYTTVWLLTVIISDLQRFLFIFKRDTLKNNIFWHCNKEFTFVLINLSVIVTDNNNNCVIHWNLAIVPWKSQHSCNYYVTLMRMGTSTVICF